MINYKNARPYVIYDGFIFQKNPKRPTTLVYFSENSTFFEDYPFLSFRRIDFKHVKIPSSRIPRTILTGQDRKRYKDEYGLIAVKEDQPVPRGLNHIYDCTNFIKQVDKKYKPKTYRQRFGNILRQMLNRGFKYSSSDHKILYYSVRIDKDFNESFIKRKIMALEEQLRKNEFVFDDMVLALVTPNGVHQRILIKEREYTYTRIKKYLKNINQLEEDLKNQEIVKNVSNEIIKHSDYKFDDNHKEAIKDAVNQLITVRPSVIDEYSMGDSKEQIQPKQKSDKSNEIIAIAIMAASNGDVDHSHRLVQNALETKTSKEVLDLVDKNLSKDLLVYEKPVVDNDSIALGNVDLAKATGNRSPEHILNKRKKDFQENLIIDVKNAFESLKDKDISVKVKSVVFEDIPNDPKNLARTDITKVKIELIGHDGKKHKVEIHIPKISEDGTFWINGKRKCLLNQLIQLPITFPKPFMAKFESSYSTFHIYSKYLRGGFHLEVFMGTYKLPFPYVIFFGFGFESTLKLMSIKYKIVDSISKDDEYYIPLVDKKYLLFNRPANELNKQFLYTIMKYPMKPIGNLHIFDKEYWAKLLIQTTGRVNSVYFIQNNIDNVVDSVCKQILKTKALPTRLDHIMLYMAARAASGYTMKRNDLSNQRIRSSEIVVHLLQKQILSAYTIYKERTLAGDTDAAFEINKTKVLSEFITSEIVANMEYANPVEELATMVSITPIGKEIGGIPDKRAINDEARNLSESYYGNIDPVDTPEGGGVGITQHLALGAAITSGRGLFKNQDFEDGMDSGSLSSSAVLVPFVQNNDGNRVMFGVGQMKQAVPLLNPEPPAVQTGFESILTNSLSDHFVKRAPCDGVVKEVKEREIIINCGKLNKNQSIDITPIHLSSGSGRDTLSTFQPKVKVGQKVKHNQRLAEGGCISDGFISMGRTLCTAVTTYKGYNFEDGIVINETVLESKKMVSEHGIVEEIELAPSDKILFIEKVGVETEKGQILLQKTIGELDELLGFDDNDSDILEDISDGKLIRKSPGGKIVDIEVFSNVPEDKEPDLLKDLIKRTNRLKKAKGPSKYRTKKGPIKGILIKFKINQQYNIGVGDKLTNRHGAKGIVSLVEQDKNMPVTPWGDKVEIIVSPIGIINRMNIGQLFELYTGLIAKGLALFILNNQKNKSAIITMIKKVLGVLDKTDKKIILTSIVANFNSMNQEKFNLLVSEMKKYPFFPIIVPPFKSPKVNDLKIALGYLGFKTSYNLMMPEYQVKTIQPVPVGYMYIEKLEHIAALKLHARSTGPVTNKTGQPTAGKRRGGGQRIGEQDVHSLLSHNCYATLQEIFGAMSDDKGAKNEELSNIMRNGSTQMIKSKTSPTKELLNCYFTAMMLERK